MSQRWQLYLGILLISLATLALEILQVRIFSVMLWHHLAYMVITVTLLGFSAAGAYVAIKGSGTPEQARNKAAWSALLSAVTTIIGFSVVTRVPLDTYMADSGLQLGFIFLYYAFLIVPYFFMGLTITLILTRFTEIVHKLYFWNLLGSALGCVVFLILLMNLGGEASIFASAALAAVAAVPLFTKNSLRGVAVGLTVLLLAAVPFGKDLIQVMPAPSKALGQFYAGVEDLKVESSVWDPIARIDVVSAPSFSKMMRYHEAEVKKIFTIDGDAFTFFYGSFGKPWPEVDLIGKTLYASAYFFKDKPKVAIIGLGGGTDIVTALHFQSPDVTAVEINQAMIDAAVTSYSEYPMSPYKDPAVTVHHAEGRAFLRRANDKYDIIQMSGVDTWSALATGAYVLSENYLYTREAFEEYYDHLKPNGIMSMIRWIFDPPREMLRLATTQATILKDRGFDKPWNHIVVLKQGLLASCLTKMTPFTKGEITKLRATLRDKPELEILYAPGYPGNNAFYRYFEAMKQNKDQLFVQAYPYKLDPVSDDRPFFFEFYKWRDTFSTQFGSGGYLIAARPVGYIILMLSLVQAFVLGCVFILLPLWRFKRDGLSTQGTGRMIIYFAALGLGFMFVEVALMQKFVLFLGHPTFSITVTLFSILIFSGVGSMIAGRLKMEPRRLILLATIGVSSMVLIYGVFLTPLFNSLLGLTFIGRVLTSILLIAPLGIMMGMPFPTGLSFVERGARSFVPWAFGINGVASVAGSVLCIILALLAGFTTVLATAIVIYLIGGFVMSRLTLAPTGEKD
jgi:spermidine synthase